MEDQLKIHINKTHNVFQILLYNVNVTTKMQSTVISHQADREEPLLSQPNALLVGLLGFS